MHSSKLLAFTAVGMLASASVAVAAATQVNITDPKATSRAARVEEGNRLAVQEVAPASFYHASTPTLTINDGCVQIAAPPNGKALIIHLVRANAYVNTNPGGWIGFYTDASCTVPDVGFISPPTIGLSTMPFDPGFALSSGTALYARVSSNSLDAAVYVDGYIVASGVAPPAGQTIEIRGASRP